MNDSREEESEVGGYGKSCAGQEEVMRNMEEITCRHLKFKMTYTYKVDSGKL